MKSGNTSRLLILKSNKNINPHSNRLKAKAAPHFLNIVDFVNLKREWILMDISIPLLFKFIIIQRIKDGILTKSLNIFYSNYYNDVSFIYL